jgi:hypothetical protein
MCGKSRYDITTYLMKTGFYIVKKHCLAVDHWLLLSYGFQYFDSNAENEINISISSYLMQNVGQLGPYETRHITP